MTSAMYKPLRTGFAPLFVSALAVIQGQVLAVEMTAESKPASHLLFALSDPEDTHAKDLAECEKLTIQGYRERGTRVTEISHADFKKWLDGEGKPFGKSQKNFQYVSLAKSKNANAVGGLSTFEITAEMAAGSPMQPGVHFQGWGYALSGCAHASGTEFSGKEVRAIPLRLGEGNDPWTVPTGVEPKTCSPGSGGSPFGGESNKGKPFLGVQLDGTKIQQVTPESPAFVAGLKSGDHLLGVNGSAIKDLSELAALMAKLAPGNEVEIEVKREDETFKKKVVLADRHEAVDAKRNQEGKQLPGFTATDINGREVKLESLRGKVVLLDFWATWCGPCKEEMPLLQLLSEKVKDRDFVWVGISVDDDKDAWESYVRDNRLGGIQLRSPEFANSMFVGSFPTVMLVDRTGTIRCSPRGEGVAQSALSLLADK